MKAESISENTRFQSEPYLKVYISPTDQDSSSIAREHIDVQAFLRKNPQFLNVLARFFQETTPNSVKTRGGESQPLQIFTEKGVFTITWADDKATPPPPAKQTTHRAR